MNARSQTLSAWSGLVCIVVMFVAIWPAAHFFPPPSAALPAADIAAIYQGNSIGIRLGGILMLLAGALFAPFAAVLSAQIQRIEQYKAPGQLPVLAYTQLAAGAGAVLLFVIPGMFWIGAAYRPERAPEITQALNDLGWLCFVGNPFLALIENAVIGFAIISDRRAQPVFPRWVGYFNFWSVVLFLPGIFVAYFKTGPFAWNGVLAFWLPATVFFAWFVVMLVYVIRAIRQQAGEHRG